MKGSDDDDDEDYEQQETSSDDDDQEESSDDDWEFGSFQPGDDDEDGEIHFEETFKPKSKPKKSKETTKIPFKARPLKQCSQILIDPVSGEQWTRSFGKLIPTPHDVENLGFDGAVSQREWGPKDLPRLNASVIEWISVYWNLNAMGWMANCTSDSIRSKLKNNSITLESPLPFIPISQHEMVGYWGILLKSTTINIPLKDLWSKSNQ